MASTLRPAFIGPHSNRKGVFSVIKNGFFLVARRVFSRICVQILAFGADFQPPKKKKEGKFKNFPQRHPPTGESVRLDCANRRAAKGRRRKGFPSWAGNAPAHSITDNLTHRLFCAYGAVSKEKARQGRVRPENHFQRLGGKFDMFLSVRYM